MNAGEGKKDQEPPGQPLWERAEQFRVNQGWTQEELAERIGIGRVTLMRLKTQVNKPQARTVNKIADAIGISHTEAGILAGLIDPPPGFLRMAQALADANFNGPAESQLRKAVRKYREQNPYLDAEEHIDALREAGREEGKTLGDMLVETKLAKPDELKLTKREPDVEEVEDDPNLSNDVKRELIDGYQRVLAEVAELRSQMER